MIEMNCCSFCGEGEVEYLEIFHQPCGVRVGCPCGMSGPLVEGMDDAVREWNKVQAPEMLEILKDRAGYYYERNVPHQWRLDRCMCRTCIDERVKNVIEKAEREEDPT